MAFFINPLSEYPRHIGDIQIEYPNWNYGDVLPDGWQEVADGIVPEVNADEYWIEISPNFSDGVLTRQFEVKLLTEEMIKSRELFLSSHNHRNKSIS